MSSVPYRLVNREKKEVLFFCGLGLEVYPLFLIQIGGRDRQTVDTFSHPGSGQAQ
jgi:hypothetical protein